MGLEHKPGGSNIAAEQELLTLFIDNCAGQQAGESSISSTSSQLAEKIGELAGRRIVVYALHAYSNPIEIVNQADISAGEAEVYTTRSGYIMRRLTEDGKLGIALSKPQAKRITRKTKNTYYAVEVCDPATGEPNVGFIIH